MKFKALAIILALVLCISTFTSCCVLPGFDLESLILDNATEDPPTEVVTRPKNNKNDKNTKDDDEDDEDEDADEDTDDEDYESSTREPAYSTEPDEVTTRVPSSSSGITPDITDEDTVNIPTASQYSEGLAFASNYDGTCYVADLGACTDKVIFIPTTSPDGDTVTGIGSWAFEYTDIEEIISPDTVTQIGWSAFWGCHNLTTVYIGKGVNTIENNPFPNCSSLTNIAVDNDNENFKSINGNLYSKDGKSVVSFASGQSTNGSYSVPYGVEVIATGAFQSTNFEHITLPETVWLIGEDAFYCCYNLKTVKLPESLLEIGSYAFSFCNSMENIDIPKNVGYIYPTSLSNCTGLKSISVALENEYYKSIDGNLYSKDGETLITYAPGKTENSFTVLNGVTQIGEYCFSDAINLVNITLPSSLKSIGRYAFNSCLSLKTITVPEGVEYIGDDAFCNCSALVEIVLPSTITRIESWTFEYCESLSSITIPEGITYIGYDAFYHCTSLEEIILPSTLREIDSWAFEYCSNLTSITIPDGVTSIKSGAFNNCTALEEITLPKSLTFVGQSAFLNCENLTAVYFKGTASEWSNIEFEEFNEKLLDSTIVYNYK